MELRGQREGSVRMSESIGEKWFGEVSKHIFKRMEGECRKGEEVVNQGAEEGR